MTHDKTKPGILHEIVPGPLERMRFSTENDGEKSLLTLIEEHRPRSSESTATSSEGDWSSSPNSPNDVDEDEGYRLDHRMMRLGGNGF